MLTTIQENVTVGKNGLIQLHTRGLKYNSRISVVAVLEIEEKKTEKVDRQSGSVLSKESDSNTALGILSKYANPALQHLEKDAFTNAVGEKYAIS